MAVAHRSGLARWRTCIAIATIACLIVALLSWQYSASVTPKPWQQYVPSQPGSPQSVSFDQNLVPKIEAFCSDCHGTPIAENYPRDAWHDKVWRAYQYYARSGRNDLEPPPIHETVAYYRSLAPEQIVLPQPPEAKTAPGVTFTPQHFSLGRKSEVPPGIGFLRWIDLKQDGNPVLVICDLQRGYLFSLDPNDPGADPRILAQLDNPCHVAPCDLDNDGLLDLVVADLGSFQARDHDRGRVVWLRCLQPGSSYEEIVIASELGRLANNQPVDIDGDGDLDLLVGVFGYSKTGEIALLRNIAVSGDRPQFELEVLDPRPGTSHLLVQDLNDDDLPDFLALTSQEYELVSAFTQQADGKFHRRTLWAGPDPTYGLTGMVPVDMDQDGALDILFTNGDTFDDQYVKPSHGVQWLKNLGDQQYAYHRLTDLPGAHAARAGDFDLDGDLDLVAVSWLSDELYPVGAVTEQTASIVYLEQTSPGLFESHTLEAGLPRHATLEVADFDNDGDLDFAVGWYLTKKWRHIPHGTTVWWNQNKP